MKIEVGDIVKAGCKRGKARVIALDNNNVVVKYLTNYKSTYTYRVCEVNFVERPLKKGEVCQYTSSSVLSDRIVTQDVLLLALEGDWAMVMLSSTNSEYPIVVKSEHLSNKFTVNSKQTAVEAIDKALRSEWHREKNEYLNMVRNYLSR